MIIRLTIRQAGAGFRATISRREEDGKGTVGQPQTFLVNNKEEAKKRAKDLARSLGLKTYRVVDRTVAG
jgi:predicted dinucleotide-binding enzyme